MDKMGRASRLEAEICGALDKAGFKGYAVQVRGGLARLRDGLRNSLNFKLMTNWLPASDLRAVLKSIQPNNDPHGCSRYLYEIHEAWTAARAVGTATLCSAWLCLTLQCKGNLRR
jgi:hypothetical protein